ncbi:hypothetical protein HK097_009290 [Rhizophlyctis rosea]|uniref:Uncharacterized protein n=1 Tax=Rhizophlyctis rosea TaxID=64517 RepID=A0AAD5X7P0_9FUNG|nr:hypothetical protein HK097_009290 [Rhizophlyctis rosea]
MAYQTGRGYVPAPVQQEWVGHVPSYPPANALPSKGPRGEGHHRTGSGSSVAGGSMAVGGGGGGTGAGKGKRLELLRGILEELDVEDVRGIVKEFGKRGGGLSDGSGGK